MQPGVIYEACSPAEPGAQEMTLQYFADNNLADKVLPPRITMRDFEKVLTRARPTVGKSDLEVFEKFTAEFGELSAFP
jgi:vacuolar protein-sorting-associated protein 4